MLVITVDAYALSTECICSLGSDLENEANLSHATICNQKAWTLLSVQILG